MGTMSSVPLRCELCLSTRMGNTTRLCYFRVADALSMAELFQEHAHVLPCSALLGLRYTEYVQTSPLLPRCLVVPVLPAGTGAGPASAGWPAQGSAAGPGEVGSGLSPRGVRASGDALTPPSCCHGDCVCCC